MKKRFLTNLINLIALTIALMILFWIQIDNINFSLEIIIVATFVNAVLLRFYIEMIKTTFVNTLWLYSFQILLLRGRVKRYDSVRTSFSQLYRVKIDGKYLLVKSNKSGLFQSPAETYNISNEVQLKKLDKLNLRHEPNYSYTRNQFKYRLYAKDVRQLIKTLNKLYTQKYIIKYAEFSFYDTMKYYGIEDTVLLKNHSFIIFKGRYIPEILFSRREQMFEVFVHDIIEVELDDKCKEYLRSVINNKSNSFKLAFESEINKLGTNSEIKDYTQTITEFSERILEVQSEHYIYPKKG